MSEIETPPPAQKKRPTETSIIAKLDQRFSPDHLEVENESDRHSVPKNSETHFRVLIVATVFDGMARIQRQRLVNETLASELANGVHALAQRCLTPDEWSKTASEFKSPDCRGGSKS